MIIEGIITELPTPAEHAARTERGKKDGKGLGIVGVGVKKRTRGKPTFFRVTFQNSETDMLATHIVEDYAPGDPVVITADESTIQMVWEVDEIARTSAVIKVWGTDIAPADEGRP